MRMGQSSDDGPESQLLGDRMDKQSPCRCRANEANQQRDVWKESGCDKRGWVRIVCRFCGRFIGYKQKEVRT